MVPWMSGLVNGLQNRLQQFESARHLQQRSLSFNLLERRGFAEYYIFQHIVIMDLLVCFTTKTLLYNGTS